MLEYSSRGDKRTYEHVAYKTGTPSCTYNIGGPFNKNAIKCKLAIYPTLYDRLKQHGVLLGACRGTLIEIQDNQRNVYTYCTSDDAELIIGVNLTESLVRVFEKERQKQRRERNCRRKELQLDVYEKYIRCSKILVHQDLCDFYKNNNTHKSMNRGHAAKLVLVEEYNNT